MNRPKSFEPIHVQALLEFRQRYGFQWKAVLRQCWARGTYPADFKNSGALQQVRNTACNTFSRVTTRNLLDWYEDDQYIKQAAIRHEELSVDPKVSRAAGGGCWVAGWVFVPQSCLPESPFLDIENET